jgi:putative endonuclease
LLRFARNDEKGGGVIRNPSVYIMANKRNGTVYAGVTSNLPQRAYQHREELVEGFSKDNDCKILVWYEQHLTMETVILREKQIKGGSRVKKLKLIEEENPRWEDLYEDIAHG